MGPEEVGPQNVPDPFDLLNRVADFVAEFLEFMVASLVVFVACVSFVP